MKTSHHQGCASNFCCSLSGVLFVVLTCLSVRAQPEPHHLENIGLLPDRTMSLRLAGSASNMFPDMPVTVSNQFRQMFDLYLVEASTNLVDWERLALLPRTNSDTSPLLFRDTNAANFNERFYRTPTNHLITGFPTPTGPYAIGTFSRVLTDPSRTNRYGLPTNSSFMCTFWYPAEPPAAGYLPGPYTDRAVAADRSFYDHWGYSNQWTSAVPQFVGRAVPGLPVAVGTNRFPAILHSHGYTCDRRLNAQSAEELASHGFVVAAVDHVDCHATVYPDGRVCYVPPGSYTNEAAGVPSRTNDLQCLLAELARADSDDSLLAGRLDLGHIGVTGFSFGGGTAAETCRADPRIKCAALLDGYVNFTYYPALYSQGLQKPFLAMNRTVLTDGFPDFSFFSQRLFSLATTNATWLKIANTKHFDFSDWAWSVDLTAGSRPGAVAIDACLVWFFETYLNGETPPFPTTPELLNVQRK